MTWYKVAKENEMKDGDLAKVNVNGTEVLIIKDSSTYYATSPMCTHENYDLSEGFMDDHQLICPNHFATFNPKDGKVISPPEGSGNIPPLKSFAVRIENGDVQVELP